MAGFNRIHHTGIMSILVAQSSNVTCPTGTVCHLLLFLPVFLVALSQLSNKHRNTTNKNPRYFILLSRPLK